MGSKSRVRSQENFKAVLANPSYLKGAFKELNALVGNKCNGGENTVELSLGAKRQYVHTVVKSRDLNIVIKVIDGAWRMVSKVRGGVTLASHSLARSLNMLSSIS